MNILRLTLCLLTLLASSLGASAQTANAVLLFMANNYGWPYPPPVYPPFQNFNMDLGYSASGVANTFGLGRVMSYNGQYSGGMGSFVTNSGLGSFNLGNTNADNGLDHVFTFGDYISAPASRVAYFGSTNIPIGIATTATNTYTFPTTSGLTNATGKDIQILQLTGTSLVYSNAASKVTVTLGTISPGLNFILKPGCSIKGTGCSATLIEDL